MIPLPEGTRLEAGSQNLPRISIARPEARAELYLHGATLTAWQPKSHAPVLWLSRASLFQPDKAIRGGIPICFPWFGPARAPQHGFARITPWTLVSARELSPMPGVELQLELRSSDATLAAWPHHFLARSTLRISEKLELDFYVENTGETPFSFEAALHTYFAVKDVRNVRVHGLEGSTYADKVAAMSTIQGDAPIAITGETDRVYESSAACELRDPGLARVISIQKDASKTTIVWNPWIDKARSMKDFGDDEWPEMLCIESANAKPDAVTLEPGTSHTMRVRIVVNAA